MYKQRYDMYKPSYDALEDYYFFKPDHYDELEEWENRLGRIEEWDVDDLYAFVEAVTGDTVKAVELDKQMLLITYTI